MSKDGEARIVHPAHQDGMMALRHVREVEGIRFHEEGPAGGSAEAILFLHGIGGGAGAFEPQLRHFGKRYRAVAWEMPGYGGSAPLPLVTMAALAASLGEFIAAAGLGRPVVVGHSLGGMVLQRLLVGAPHIVRAAVLSQTSAAFGSRDPTWGERFVADALGPLDAGRSMAAMAPDRVAALVGEGADPDGIAAAVRGFASVPESTYRDMVLAMPGFDERAALAQIAVPTLVLAGSADKASPPAGCERMASRIPGARYHCLDGAGHLAHAERPDAFNAALDSFLDGL